MKQINKCALLALFIFGVAECTYAHAVENTKAYTFPSSEQPVQLCEATLPGTTLLVIGGLVAVGIVQFVYAKWNDRKKDVVVDEDLVTDQAIAQIPGMHFGLAGLLVQNLN